MSLEAEPFEQARFCSGSRDEGRDEFPALVDVVDVGHPDGVSLAVLADDPNQNLEVTDTPVPLQLAGLSHPR